MCSNRCSNVYAWQCPEEASAAQRPAAMTSIDRYEPSLQPGGQAAERGRIIACSTQVQQPQRTLPTASDRYSPHRQRKDLQRPRRLQLRIRRQTQQRPRWQLYRRRAQIPASCTSQYTATETGSNATELFQCLLELTGDHVKRQAIVRGNNGFTRGLSLNPPRK
jgi:hypothetical protein